VKLKISKVVNTRNTVVYVKQMICH